MPVPLVVAGALLAASAIGAAWNIYQTDQTTKLQDKTYTYTRDFQRGYYDENSRFWNDYIRLHHLENRKIMYPYRTGYNYDLSKMYTADRNLDINSLNRTGSIVRGFTGMGSSAAYLYGAK